MVRAVAAVGNPRDTLKITGFLKTGDTYSNETYKEIFNAAGKIGRVKDAEVLKPFLKHEDEGVKKAAQSAVDSINKRNIT